MALGLIGSGVLAVPILTGCGAYAVAESLGWKCGLDAKPYKAKAFYLVIAASTAAGLAIADSGIDPMSALFWTAVINGILAPPVLLVVMLIANNRKIMGRRANGPFLNALGWATTALMTLAAVVLCTAWCRSVNDVGQSAFADYHVRGYLLKVDWFFARPVGFLMWQFLCGVRSNNLPAICVKLSHAGLATMAR